MEVVKPTARRVWRVFYTMARAEKKCETRLEAQGMEVLLPKCIEVRQWKDRKKKVIEPLFRNYIFANVNERERLDVLQTNGIVKSVMFGGKIAQLSDHEAEQLQISQRDPERLALVTRPLPRVGSRVTVIEGPMQGLEGLVLEQRSDERLVIGIDVPTIQQAFRVVLSADTVRSETGERLELKVA